jgi:hypothetical protein
MKKHSKLLLWSLAIAALATIVAPQDGGAQEVDPQARLIKIELFVKRGDSKSSAAKRVLTKFQSERPGLNLVLKEIDRDSKARERYNHLSRTLKLKNPRVPLVYGCNHWIMGYESDDNFLAHLRNMLLVQVFESEDCESCELVPQFMDSYMDKYPGFQVVYISTAEDDGRKRFNKVLSGRRLSQRDVNMPMFYLCNKVSMGFESDATKAEQLDKIFEPCTIPGEVRAAVSLPSDAQVTSKTWPGDSN